MPSLKDIRKRIGSVKNTQKITSALKLVSAAKLSRSQREMARLKPYADKQKGLIRDLVDELDDTPSPLFEERAEVHKVVAVVLCSDRGMCGGFNTNLLKKLKQFVKVRTEDGAEVSCWSLGRRVYQFVNKQGYTLGENLGEIANPELMDQIPQATQRLIQSFEEGEVDEVVIISNRFINALTQTPTVQRFLPIQGVDAEAKDEAKDEAKRSAKDLTDRIYEPDRQTLLNFILPCALETQIRQSILESITGEHAARMNAMSNATDNANDMINTLTLDLNRARQAAITAELMEIISGAEALK